MRETLKALLFTGAAALTGCASTNIDRGSLPVNTVNNAKIGKINSNEDKINIQKVNLLGETYFMIPLNTETRVLNGGEPSFGLIPELKARISVRKVGEKGGEVVVDAPNGDFYLPYALTLDNINLVNYTANFSEEKPIRFITNRKMKDISKTKEGESISLERISQKDLPYSDNTLKVIGKEQYIVNKAEDYEDSDFLNIYLTKTPVDVEYNRSEEDGRIRIRGITYMFSNEDFDNYDENPLEDYLDKRGYVNPLEKKVEETKKESTVTLDDSQD